MTTLINEPEAFARPKPTQESIDPGQRLRLASDNPAPVTAGAEAEPVGAAIQMATYRLSAVFGEIRWVGRDVA